LLIVRTESEEFTVDVIGTPPCQSTPGRMVVVAHADFRSAVCQTRQRGSYLEAMIGDVVLHVTGIFREKFELAGIEIEQIGIMKARVALVEGDNQLIWKAAGAGNYACLQFARRQVTRGSRLPSSRNLKQVPVFIAVPVLQVYEVLTIFLPEELPDAALWIRGHATTCGSRLGNSAHPTIQHAILGGDPRERFTIRRNLRMHAFGISEQHFARNQRWQFA